MENPAPSQHVLHVSTQGIPVGQVSFDALTNRYGFRYATSWLQRADAWPLAPAIALGAAAAPPESVQRFLENLLPEGHALDIAAAVNQVSKHNIFALVRLLGKEPVGALSFLAQDATTQEAHMAEAQQQQPLRRPVSDAELSRRIRDRDAVPFPVWDGKVRLSLAGYQDKLQILVDGDQLALADGALSSTHLLKPDSRSRLTPYMVANEHYCMTLASQIGLPVAPVTIRRVPEPVLLVERFDRIARHQAGQVSAVQRRHVIDGCQALDLPVSYKYERNFGAGPDVMHIREGVSFTRLFGMLDLMLTPATARLFLLRWALLNLLIGNSDAHGKNVSFHVHPAGLEPAPLYDLVCAKVYGDAIDNDMAMAYGDAFRLEDIRPFQLADFATRTRTPAAQMAREITGMARRALAIAPVLAASGPYTQEERALVSRLSDFICMRAETLLDYAPQIPRVRRQDLA